MSTFNAIEWRYIKDRGWSAITRLDRERDETDMASLARSEVYIDGIRYKCIGVERFAHMPPWREGELVSLLIDAPEAWTPPEVPQQ